MGSLLSYLVTYIVGGCTLIPLALFLIWHISPKVPVSKSERDLLDREWRGKESIRRGEPNGYRDLKAGEVFDRENTGVKAFHSGWITVTKEFYKFPQINPDDFKQNLTSGTDMDSSSSNSNSSSTAGGIFTKIIKGNNDSNNTQTTNTTNLDDGFNTSKDNELDSATLGATKLKQIRKRNRYFGVIKHGNLFLYSDDTQKDVKHVIVLDHYTVAIWPRELTDGQLFTKRSAICLIKNDIYFENFEKTQELVKILENKAHNTQPLKNSYFLYGDLSIEKEDWYFALIRATSKNISDYNDKFNNVSQSLNPSLLAKTLHYNTADILDLIENLNATEGQLTTKWINAIIGRLFLSNYKTDEFKEAFRRKIEERLKKIRTPGFLDQLQIHRIDVGHSAPFFTNPKLKFISPEGELEATVDVLYKGKAMVEIASKVFLNLGVGFKQRQFDIIMKLTLNKIEGEVLIKMKPQPSSRIWYTYSKMPEIDITIEPVVSSRTINYGIVTSIIESRFKDAIKSSIVYPFFDDFVFYRSPNEIFRGGIFDRTMKADSNEQNSYLRPEETSTTTLNADNDGTTTTTTELEYVKPSDISIKSKDSVDTNLSKFPEKDSYMSKLDSISSESEIQNELKTTPEILEDDLVKSSDQIKDTVLKSYSRIKHWYKKAPQGSTESSLLNASNGLSTSTSKSTTAVNKELNYTPPEMISNRRRKASRTESIKHQDMIAQLDTNSSSSFQLISSNINYRPSADAFINLERKRNGSQSSQFGSVSSIDEHQFSTPVPHSPASPEMFINEKFKSPKTSTSNASTSGMDYGGNGTRINSPTIIRFNNNNDDSMTVVPSSTHHPPQLQDSPISKGRTEVGSNGVDKNLVSKTTFESEPLNIRMGPLRRKPPSLPPKDNTEM